MVVVFKVVVLVVVSLWSCWQGCIDGDGDGRAFLLMVG